MPITQLNFDILCEIFSHIDELRHLKQILLAFPEDASSVHRAAWTRIYVLPMRLLAHETEGAHRLLCEVIHNFGDGGGRTYARKLQHLTVYLRSSIWPAHSHILRPTRSDMQTWVKVIGMKKEISVLLPMLANLRSLDWTGAPIPSVADFRVLSEMKGLRQLRMCCVEPREMRDRVVFAMDAFDADEYWDSRWNAWRPDSNYFIPIILPRLEVLELFHATRWTLDGFYQNKHRLQNCTSLKRLSIDLAQEYFEEQSKPDTFDLRQFSYQNLGFPSVEEYDLYIDDSQEYFAKRTSTALDLVDTRNIKSISIRIGPLNYTNNNRCHALFSRLSPSDFPQLRRLEIEDRSPLSRTYGYGHHFSELVPLFLKSIPTNGLANLTHLWTNECILSMLNQNPESPPPADTPNRDWHLPHYTVSELWNPREDNPTERNRKRQWVHILRVVFYRLESLRLGLGHLTFEELGLVLGSCNPDRLVQFGTHIDWQAEWNRGSSVFAVMSNLAKPLGRFKKLKDLLLLKSKGPTYQLPPSELIFLFQFLPSVRRIGQDEWIWERKIVLRPSDPAKLQKLRKHSEEWQKLKKEFAPEKAGGGGGGGESGADSTSGTTPSEAVGERQQQQQEQKDFVYEIVCIHEGPFYNFHTRDEVLRFFDCTSNHLPSLLEGLKKRKADELLDIIPRETNQLRIMLNGSYRSWWRWLGFTGYYLLEALVLTLLEWLVRCFVFY